MNIVLLAHNIRSTHNVGSLLRTAEGLGVGKVYLTGYSPYPKIPDDTRLPHEAEKLHQQIHKTALGAEELVSIEHYHDVLKVIEKLKTDGYRIVALEQADNSIPLPSYRPQSKIALIIGREVEGIEPEVLKVIDDIVEIPMQGKKESFNVSVAAAIALYHFQHYQDILRRS